jgi:hypothetical protein
VTEDAIGWTLYPSLLLRRAGFGFDLLTGLADERVLGALKIYRDCALHYENARAELLARIGASVGRAGETGDKDALRELSKLRSKAGRRLPVTQVTSDPELAEATRSYTVALGEKEAADRRLTGELVEEQQRRPERVHTLLSDDRVCDALLQLSPSFHEEVLRWLDGWPDRSAKRNRSKDRAFYRRAYLYGQRLGAKNETTSFFGPLVHGRIDAATTGISLGPETESGVLAVKATVAFWTVCELAAAIGADSDIRDRLPVTWMPACRRSSGVVQLATGQKVRLADWQARLVDLVDDTRSTADLARLTGRDVQAVAKALDRLQHAGALRLRPEPPSTAADPLNWLIDWTHRYLSNTAWPGRLAELWSLAARYAAADGHLARSSALGDIEQWFTSLTEVDARRASGRMYADRLVVSLDAQGDQTPILVGAAVARRWERQLSPVLDAAAQFGELQQQAANTLCAGVLRAAGVDSMPYDELIRRISEVVDAGGLDALRRPTDQLVTHFGELVRVNFDGTEAVLDPADLAALAPGGARTRFVSPDLMLEQHPDGRELLVLGELHPYVFAWGSQGLFSEDRRTMLDDFAADLQAWGGADRIATMIRRRRHKGLVVDSFPGRFIEVTAHATDDRTRTLALTDVNVVLVDEQARLRTGDGELVLYAGEDDHVHLRAFAAPGVALPLVRFGDFAPRIVVGGVLVQRARWWLSRADLALGTVRDSAAALRAVQRLRVSLGLPRFCFAHIAHEPKPVGVDLDNPLAVDALVALLMAGQDSDFALAEMRPAQDALWLHHHSRPTTSEFRLAMRRTYR